MIQQGIIFDANYSPQSGTFVLYREKKPLRFSLRHFLGGGLLSLSLLSAVWFFGPIVRAEFNYRLWSLNRQEAPRAFSLPTKNLFELSIPKIGAKTTVALNADLKLLKNYQSLLAQQAVHAQGSNLPDEGGMVFIFGHSTNSPANAEFFNPLFYSLKEVKKNDLILLTYQGKTYRYQTAERKIVAPDDFDDILAIQDRNSLVLQTCWPPGTTWKRLLVIALPTI